MSARQFTIREQNFVLAVLNDARAWPAQWLVTRVRDRAHWSVALETQEYINSILSDLQGLSVTYMMTRPRKTLFSYENWSNVPGPCKRVYNILEYRTYLVLHECGHALGLGHVRAVSGPVPIMMQQTLGIGHCEPNIWPLQKEKLRLAREQDIVSENKHV